MNNTHYHFGTDADLDAVMRVMSTAFDPNFGEAWTAAQCSGVLGLPGMALLLASVDDAPAGFALTRVILDEAELLLLAVHPLFRGRGIGDALLARAGEAARIIGATHLHLEVREGNRAISLYKRSGFIQTGRRSAYYRGRDGQLFDALSLTARLDNPHI